MTTTVAVNEAILLRGISGSARAARQLTAAMTQLSDVSVRGVRPTGGRSSSRLRNAVRDARWDLRGAAAAAGQVDVLVSPCNIGLAVAGQRHLLFVHDVMLWESPKLFDPLFAHYARPLIRLSAARADRVLTTTRHSAAVLGHLVPSADIHVLPLPGQDQAATPTRGRTGALTVLMVGETAAHKNHVIGIEAVRLLRSRRGVDVSLRLVGPRGNAETAVREALEAADPERTWTQRQSDLSDDEMRRAYATAWVLLQPSLNEGYGLPLVEASQHGVPVVHSGAGGMSEVLPSSSVDSPGVDSYERQLATVLDEREWQHASSTVLAEAPRFSWGRFRSAVDGHLRDLAARVGQ